MLSIGFDPSFIDTIVRAETPKGELIGELPEPGFHHRNTKIYRVAGGNAVNIAYVLSKLDVKFDLIIPSTPLFDTLLKRRGLSTSYQIHHTVNETVAISWRPGEIQFNQIIGEISSDHFTREVYDFWNQSDIQVSVNWGLNYKSPSWLSCLWLSSCGWAFEEIKELTVDDLLKQALEEKNLRHNLVLEPGSVHIHPKSQELMDLLETISTASYNQLYPVFSCNEEEDREFAALDFTSKLIHTSKQVTCYQHGSKQIFEVPEISDIKTFVGAGDSFVAGIVHQLYKHQRLDPAFAISVAQRYMTNTL